MGQCAANHEVCFILLLLKLVIIFKVCFVMQRSKMIRRLVNTVQSFRQAINLAPDAWSAMLIRTLLKPESQKFVLDVFLALANHSSYKIPETFWLFMSRFLNYLDKQDIL
ncbi:Ubiquinone biosynthesis protein ubiB [Zea mays]|jgi:aarF domain-containing kinase|uniref:Ubiquinone biosynthesis protein ubiB n=1 Tax=Zea mays TaxID=4577 RepID=A0A1D6HZ54_MAIZE|nr:Ubiquinone biosynthesis protein ubiB [Zea mays]